MTEDNAEPWSQWLIEHSWWEPCIYYLLALLFIWRIQPRGPVWSIGGFLLLTAIPIASHLLHRERPRDLGFRLDNLRSSARRVGVMTGVAAAVILLIALLARGGSGFRHGLLIPLLTLPLWALAQQYVLQAFVLRRLMRVTGTWSGPFVASVLFGFLHYPNPVLMPLATIAGVVWCRLYLRRPNLYTLALSHAVLAWGILIGFPAGWTHDLRVGPGYRTWEDRTEVVSPALPCPAASYPTHLPNRRTQGAHSPRIRDLLHVSTEPARFHISARLNIAMCARFPLRAPYQPCSP